MAYFTKLLKLTRLQARLPITQADGTGTTAFIDVINRAFANIEQSTNAQGELLNQVADILKITKEIKSDQEKAAYEKSLVDSYTDPTQVLSSTTNAETATVVVANHNRIYTTSPATTVAVTGKTFTGLDLNTIYYFFYDDAKREGGAVNIMYSKDNLDAAQMGIRHSLGSIQTPPANTTEPETGGGIPPRGGEYYRYKYDQKQQEEGQTDQ